MTITDNGQPRRIDVPIEMPEGVSRAGVFGEDDEKKQFKNISGVANLSVGVSPTVTVTATNSPALNSSVSTVGPVTARQVRNLPPKAHKSRARKDGGAGVGGSGMGSAMGTGRGAASSPQMNADSNAVVRTEDEPALSPEAQQRLVLQSKLHPALFAIVERLNKKEMTATAEESKFVRDGRAELQIWLTEKNDEVIGQLKSLGFEIVLDPQTSKLVIGRLSIEKLDALAQLKTVRYVAPQMFGKT